MTTTSPKDNRTMITSPKANHRKTADVNTPMHIALTVLQLGTGQQMKSEELDDCFYWLMSQAQSLGIDTASWLNALATAHGHDIVNLLAENTQPDTTFFYSILYHEAECFGLHKTTGNQQEVIDWANKPHRGTGIAPLEAWDQARRSIQSMIDSMEPSFHKELALLGTKQELVKLLCKEWGIERYVPAISLFLGRNADRENPLSQAEAYSLGQWLRTNDQVGMVIATIWDREVPF